MCPVSGPSGSTLGPGGVSTVPGVAGAFGGGPARGPAGQVHAVVTGRVHGRSSGLGEPGNCYSPAAGRCRAPPLRCSSRAPAAGVVVWADAATSTRYGLGQSILATWRRRDSRRFGVPVRKECHVPARPVPGAPVPYSSSDEHGRRGCARVGGLRRPRPGATRPATAGPHHAAPSTVPFSFVIAPSAPRPAGQPGRTCTTIRTHKIHSRRGVGRRPLPSRTGTTKVPVRRHAHRGNRRQVIGGSSVTNTASSRNW